MASHADGAGAAPTTTSTPTHATSKSSHVGRDAPNNDGLADSDIVCDDEIASTWKAAIKTADHTIQVEPPATKDAANQSVERKTVAVQSEALSSGALDPSAPLPAAFPSFLQEVYPLLSETLTSNLESRAWDEGAFGSGWGMMDGDSVDANEKVFQLEAKDLVQLINTQDGNAPNSPNDGMEYSPYGGRNSSKYSRGGPSRGGFLSPPSSSLHGAGVLSVSWSCNGSVVACSYGHANHVGWCTHSSSSLAFWNVHRRQLSLDIPDTSLELDCCCLSLAYHPQQPTILAGGMFNGEIRIWDVAKIEESTTSGGMGDDEHNAEEETSMQGAAAGTHTSDSHYSSGSPLLMRSNIDDAFHREPVVSVAWFRDPSTRSWMLASISGDGRVLIWPMEDPLNKLQYPTDGFLLQPTSGEGGVTTSSSKTQMMGGAALAIARQSHYSATSDSGEATSPGSGAASTSPSSTVGLSNYFVASTEGGSLVRVALNPLLRRKGYVKTGDLRWSRAAHRLIDSTDPTAKFELKKHVEKYVRVHAIDTVELGTIFESRPPTHLLYPNACNRLFESHAGPAYGLAFNPSEPRIFASAATDGRIKIFHINQTTPLLTLDPSSSSYLLSLVWSPTRPLVLAASSSSGCVYLYDLLSSLLAPVHTLTGHTDGAAILALTWNEAEPSLLAGADAKGRVHVWNLAPRYSRIQPGEKRVVEQMATRGGGTKCHQV